MAGFGLGGLVALSLVALAGGAFGLSARLTAGVDSPSPSASPSYLKLPSTPLPSPPHQPRHPRRRARRAAGAAIVYDPSHGGPLAAPPLLTAPDGTNPQPSGRYVASTDTRGAADAQGPARLPPRWSPTTHTGVGVLFGGSGQRAGQVCISGHGRGTERNGKQYRCTARPEDGAGIFESATKWSGAVWWRGRRTRQPRPDMGRCHRRCSIHRPRRRSGISSE
jgi:hypothetical protein